MSKKWYSFRWGELCEDNTDGLCHCGGECDVWSTHLHLLMRYVLGDAVFHVPSPFFALMSGREGYIMRQHEGYESQVLKVKNTFYGKKTGTAVVPDDAEQHLRLLVKKFHMLMADDVKELRLAVEELRHDGKKAETIQGAPAQSEQSSK